MTNFDKRHLVEGPLEKRNDPVWIKAQSNARSFVGRYAVDEQEFQELLEILGLAA